MRRPGLDTIRVDSTNGIFDAQLNVVRFQDADTLQHIAYIPALEISGYGKSKKAATRMLKFSINEFFKFLIALKPYQQKKELMKLRWKRKSF